MTATVVSGMRVVETFQVPTGSNQKPNGVDNGIPAMYRQIVGLVLENGHRTYGCLHCEYTNDNVNSVRPHLNRHGVKGDGQTPKAKRIKAAQEAGINPNSLADMPALSMQDLRSMSLEDLLRLANRARKVVDQVDHWKGRALAAERDLNALRDALRGAMGTTTSG